MTSLKQDDLNDRLRAHAANGLSVEDLAPADKKFLLEISPEAALSILTTTKGNLDELIKKSRQKTALLFLQEGLRIPNDEKKRESMEEKLSAMPEIMREIWGGNDYNFAGLYYELSVAVEQGRIPKDSLTDEQQNILDLGKELDDFYEEKGPPLTFERIRDAAADLVQYCRLTKQEIPSSIKLDD